MNTIKHIQFIDGVVGEKPILTDGIPQIAFIGRSNVGKSSTLNSLFGGGKRVKTGKTPGKTKEINFFRLEFTDERLCYCVDLPGYGYAKLSKTERTALSKLILWYLEHKGSFLELVVLIIDAKVGLTELDKEIISILEREERTFVLGVNKIDKINQKKTALLKKELLAASANWEHLQKIIYYSAAKNKHINQLSDFLFGQEKGKSLDE